MSEISERPRWVLKKHTRNISLLIDVAIYLKEDKSNLSIESRKKMYDSLAELPHYNPRKSLRDKPLDSVNHRLDELRYYMFGYHDKVEKQQKFIFSPLGNLFLKCLENKEVKKLANIFLTMLFAIQFPHIGSAPSLNNFSLYPFRLIIKLLTEDKIGRKLYHYEIITILMFIQKMEDEQDYKSLLKEILESRKQDDDSKIKYLKNDEYFFVTLVYEWEYYVSNFLADLNIIDKSDKSLDSYKFIYLEHKSKENSVSSPTRRKASNGYFTLSGTVEELANVLLNKYTIYDEPLSIDNPREMSSDVVKEIYSFYPNELLVHIGEDITTIENEILHLPDLINKYSENPDNKTADLFEDVLTDAFNLFYNVEAKKLSGASNTDIECLYLEKREKFAVEAKSTQNKLTSINSGRLKGHRVKIGAKYTIVITPRYVPAVVHSDIKHESIVIIKASTFSEYLYNNIISDNREIDYNDIDEIVYKHMGTDISGYLSEKTLSTFG